MTYNPQYDHTPQGVLDFVCKHLLTQGKPSKSKQAGGCAYRGDDGLMCAVGCLISDDEYEPDMEGVTINAAQVLTVFSWAEPSTISLLESLQGVHDNWEPACWREELEALAKSYGLRFPEGL